MDLVDGAEREHPRPDRRRTRWQPLDGDWEFALDDADEGAALGWTHGVELPLRIRVPFTFETAASGLGLGDEVHEWVWYRRRFCVHRDAPDGRVLLHFLAVDWQADVWVNGAHAGRHTGGYAPFSFDVTDLLAAQEEQELVVRAYDPASPHNGGWQPRGKQRGSWRIWYTRTTGIWGSVWLEQVGRAWLDRPSLRPDARTGRITVSPGLAGRTTGVTVHAQVLRADRVVAEAQDALELELVVPRHETWSPKRPVLYDVRLQVRDGETVLDQVDTWTAFREVAAHDGNVLVNGEPVFVRGVLDQGYWPESGATAPSPQALRDDVRAAAALGFNLVRKHMKVEDPHFYRACDELGMLVAQDMPSSQDLSTEAAREGFLLELRDVLELLAERPSVIAWVLFNEDWGAPGRCFQAEAVALARRVDASRLVVEASGWISWGQGDVEDLHDYTSTPGELVVGAHGGRTRWMGEFGGVAHTRSETGWGYSRATTPTALLERIDDLVRQLDDPERLAGWIYTQLTDVESETNGLLTADREAKAPYEDVAAVLTQHKSDPDAAA